MVIKDFIEKLNPKNNKIVLFSGAVLLLIMIFIIMVNLLINALGDKRDIIPAVSGKQSDKASGFIPDANDLKIPPNYLRDPEFTWRSFRTTPDKWNREEIERFWKDPADVIIDAYSEENREHIKNILGGVP